MKNILYFVSLLGLLLLPASVQAQVTASTSVASLRPMDVFGNPRLLQSGGFEEAIPKDNYTPQEAQIQSALNAKAADALLVWSPEGKAAEWTDYDVEPITPYTWRWVDMEVLHFGGAVSQVNLLRPLWWLSDMGADEVGKVLYVEMPEVGITGEARVTNIRPTQLDTRFWDENRQGDFVSRPITGKFIHTSSDVYHLFFGLDTVPLGVTGNHRIWSKDRSDWVEAAHLRIGEAVLTRDGETTLTSRHKLLGEHTVYNIEVYRDHNFLVSVQGVVVHNTCEFLSSLTSSSIEGVSLLSGQIYKNGDKLNVNISLIYKAEGYQGRVFDNLLNELENTAAKNGTSSMQIVFETVWDKPTLKMYEEQARKYGFKVSSQKSPIGGGAVDVTWSK